MNFMVFLRFKHENLLDHFHCYIRNQCVKIYEYGEFYGNRKVHLFGTSPLRGEIGLDDSKNRIFFYVINC